MARKRTKTMDENLPEGLIAQPAETPEPETTNKYGALVAAAADLIEQYKKTHTINDVNDYRYPGLKALVEALDGLREE